MNERIEGLWWKARIGYNNQNCDPEVVAKFAELILQECMSNLYLHGYDDARAQIKEHFGVKE